MNNPPRPQLSGPSGSRTNELLWIGALAGFATLAFFMYVVTQPAIDCGNRFPALFVMALGTALSGGLIGGWAKVNGKLPVGDSVSAIAVSAGGGAALLLSVLVIGNVFYRCDAPTPPLPHPGIPGGAGWILAGKIKLDQVTGRPLMKDGRVNWAIIYIELKTTDGNGDGLPAVGNLVRLNEERNVRIVDFKTSYTTKSLVHPHEKGTLTDDDLTGVILPKGTKVEISDVDIGYYPGADNAFVWIRVSISSR